MNPLQPTKVYVPTESIRDMKFWVCEGDSKTALKMVDMAKEQSLYCFTAEELRQLIINAREDAIGMCEDLSDNRSFSYVRENGLKKYIKQLLP